MALEFLLRRYVASGDRAVLNVICRALDAIARGGIYDNVGGGFHRHAIDEGWQVPHFEKSLSDNAQMARLYLHAWQATNTALYRCIAEETCEWVLREMADPAGGFCASLNAASEGNEGDLVEGAYYLWSASEMRAVLGDGAQAFMDAHSVTEAGNWCGRDILRFRGAWEDREPLRDDCRRLLRARRLRRHPALDNKVIVSQNGLMVAALAEVGTALGREDWLLAAQSCADHLLRAARRADGRLAHMLVAGQAIGSGLVEDYACFIEGLLALYAASFASRWYTTARELAEIVIERFGTDLSSSDTSDDHEAPSMHPCEWRDNAARSGNAMAATVLLKLAVLGCEPHLRGLAQRALQGVQRHLTERPLACGQWLVALDAALADTTEVVIVGRLEAQDARALLAVARSGYRPHQTIAAGQIIFTGQDVPLLAAHAGSIAQEHTVAFVRRHGSCLPPVSERRSLERLLDAA